MRFGIKKSNANNIAFFIDVIIGKTELIKSVADAH